MNLRKSSLDEDPLQLLLKGCWPDPESGTPLGVATRAVAIEKSLAGEEAERVRALDLGHTFAVVSDPRTREVLGIRVEEALDSLGHAIPVVLEDRPHPDAATAAAVAHAAAAADSIIAVGSGTINDLCKYAADQSGKPYAVFATAPSMNGYTSMNAAITVNGHKKSLPSTAAAGVFIDLDVLAAAPVRMIRAGLGDSLCRTTAQVDWLMSHRLRGSGYRQAPFSLLADDEPRLLEEAEALVKGDHQPLAHLARTLVLSGFGMSICGGSYPASQGEHLISHYIDTLIPGRKEDYLHGEQIGVTTLTMARIQERLLDGGPPRLQASTASRDELLRRFGDQLGGECWREFERKRLDAGTVHDLNQQLCDRWEALREEIEAVRVDRARIEEALRKVGAPTRPREIGLSADEYRAAVFDARYLRDRYTFLDLATDSGCLAQVWCA